VWTGYIRHKTNTIRIAYRISGETVRFRVKYGTTVVWESDPIVHAGEETQEQTGDISGAVLTLDEFYDVTLEIKRTSGDCTGCWIVPLEVSETDTLSLPALPDCDDGDVLTAAEWNGLSAYATALSAAAQVPRPAFPSRSTRHLDEGGGILHGGLRYRSDSLRFQVWRKISATTAEMRVSVDGTTVIRKTSGDVVSTVADNIELTKTPFSEYDLYYPYYGVADLSALGLTPGACYMVSAWNTESDGFEPHPKGLLDYLYQEPAASISAVGWVDLPEWDQGDYVGGETGAPNVQDIRDNLEWLGARMTYANVAAMERKADWTSSPPREEELWLVHQHRWLWFLGEDDDSPGLRYYAGGWQEVSLPATETYGWHSYDLDQLPMLAQGQRYHVRGAFAAIEDINA
jgi:hypothetical protein